MIRSGDKIICINEKSYYYKLVKNKIYTIDFFKNIHKDEKIKELINNNYKNYFVQLKENRYFHFPLDWFMTLQEFRKIKIKRICSKLEIK